MIPDDHPMADESPNTERRHPGRPTLQTPEIIEEICNRLADGEPLAQICRSEWMPKLRTVYDWTQRDEDVSARIARARDAGEDVIGADCLRIADTPQEGVETVTKPDGAVETRRGDMLGTASSADAALLEGLYDRADKILRCQDEPGIASGITTSGRCAVVIAWRDQGGGINFDQLAVPPEHNTRARLRRYAQAISSIQHPRNLQ